MTFRALVSGEQKIFKRARDGGRWQILADALKPLFGLNRMRAASFLGDFDFRLKKGQTQWTEGAFEKISAPGTCYLIFEDSRGVPLNAQKNWQQDQDILLEYLEIALFRYGTLRFKDLHSGNVLSLPAPTNGKRLLSIDEMSIGRRKLLHAHAAGAEYAGFKRHVESLQNTIKRWQGIPADDLERVCVASGFQQPKAESLAAEIIANLVQLPQDLDAVVAEGKTAWRGQPSRTK